MATKKYVLKPLPHENLRIVQASPQFTINYQHDLNPVQYEAVTSTQGPMLVIAGAGTGKTRTIVYRVSYLIENGVSPERILLLTFTRKAAREMLSRATQLLDSRCDKVSGGTFHSFANMILRRNAQLVGYESNFTILDQSDAEDTINVVRRRLKLDERARRFPQKQTLLDIYSRSINTATPVEKIIERDYPRYIEDVLDINSVFQAYIGFKKSNNKMDYDDLLVNLVELMKSHADVRDRISAKYQFIMVDEYQDTNALQSAAVKLLTSVHTNVMVVGDDAQCIYSFRGSTIENILNFEKEYPGCKVIKLEENYRSTQQILDLANTVMKNSFRLSQ
jgi:DNA helicase II / ATP-dependent DNA helicase PcrA